MFSHALIEEECLEYYNNLGLNEYYFQTTAPEMIAKNLQARTHTQHTHKTHQRPQ